MPTFKSSVFFFFGKFGEQSFNFIRQYFSMLNNCPSRVLYFYLSMIFIFLNGVFRSFYATSPSYLTLLCCRCDLSLCNLDILTDQSILGSRGRPYCGLVMTSYLPLDRTVHFICFSETSILLGWTVHFIDLTKFQSFLDEPSTLWTL